MEINYNEIRVLSKNLKIYPWMGEALRVIGRILQQIELR